MLMKKPRNQDTEKLSKYAPDEFSSRIAFSQEMFHQIETHLRDFLDYVPLNFDHLDVHSPKLVTLMLNTGPEIIDSFDLAVFPCSKNVVEQFGGSYGDEICTRRKKLLEKEKGLRKRNKSLTFKDYYDFLDFAMRSRGGLSKATVRLQHLDAYIVPFETADPARGVNPDWWESYNSLKHDKYNNRKSATLRNALKACSALFWLVNHNWGKIHVSTFSSDVFWKFEPHEIAWERPSLTKI